MPDVKAATLREVLVTQIDRRSTVMTDEFPSYISVGREFADHQSVNHCAREYVRGEACTQKTENYFSTFQCSLHGTYQDISETHLKRFLCEVDFRHNERAELSVSASEHAHKPLRGVASKGVTYRRMGAGQAA